MRELIAPLPAERALERHRVADRRQAPVAAVRRTTTTRFPTVSSTTGGCRGTRCSARPVSAGAARDRRGRAPPGAARRRRHPAEAAALRRPHARVRRSSPTCSARRGSACGAWTRASGTTRSRDPEHFLAHDELLWSFVDIVAKGGNLLLNVGPRGVDAQIPDEQTALLGALGGWMDVNADALRTTRPWVEPERRDDRRHRRALHRP